MSQTSEVKGSGKVNTCSRNNLNELNLCMLFAFVQYLVIQCDITVWYVNN